MATTSVAALVWLPGAARAQSVDVGDPLQDYLRTLQIANSGWTGSMTILPAIDPPGVGTTAGPPTPGPAGGGPWSDATSALRVLAPTGERTVAWDVRGRAFYNSAYPVVGNDGSIWQGRGLTTSVDGGAEIRWRGVRLALKPSVTWTGNRAFETVPHGFPDQSPWAYPWRWIDWPQRFGPDPFWRVDPGQSELRLAGMGVSLGVSTRDLWWGPGVRNAIVLGNAAGGFPHAFLRTREPLDVGVGRFEAQWIFGRLARSEWFLPAQDDRGRYATGWVATFSPTALPGLHLGGTLVGYGYVPEGGPGASEYLGAFTGGDADVTDNLGSLFFRWVLSESGFEVWAEWARNDRAGGIEDFLLEPEHGQGYTLGLQKALELSAGGRLSFLAELTHLAMEGTSRLRDNPTFYAHSVVLEGYTHRGQLLGAGIGPGGIQQHVGATLYERWGRAALWLQRRVADNDAFYAWAESTEWDVCLYCQHDVTFELGAEVLAFLDALEAGGTVVLSRQRNRAFTGPDVWNLNLSVSIRRRAVAGGPAGP